MNPKPLWHWSNILIVVALLLTVIMPLAVQSDYIVHLLIIATIYAILASSLNLIMGYAGQTSLGHAAFYGIGAYTSALLATKAGLPIWVSIIIGGVAAAVIGAIIAYPSFRTRGMYFAIVTLGIGVILNQILDNWVKVTGGPMGIRDIPSLETSFGSKTALFYLLAFIAVIVLIVMKRLVNSRFGETLIAIKEDETLAQALGVNPTKWKVLAFAISTFFAGIAGAFYAHYVTYISPGVFSSTASFDILVITVIGGAGTILGPVVGSFLLTSLPEILRAAPAYRMMAYAVILALIIIFMSEGLVGRIQSIIERRTRANRDKPAGANVRQDG